MQNFVEFNAESIGTNFKSQKWKTRKLVCHFLIALFHFKTNIIKQRFFLFSGPFRTVGKFLPSCSEAEKVACSDKKKLLSNLVARVPSFYMRTKSRLKNRVTTVHLLQCKTNVFICLCFLHSSTQFKEHSFWEASINIKKNFFWFVYTCLHLFTLVYICLDSPTTV